MLLIVGLVVFFAVHLVPYTPVRDALANRLGTMRYRGVFSLLSLVGLVLIVIGWRSIPEEYLSNRYSSMIHGVGLADEYPSIKFWHDFEVKGYDGPVLPGMTLCVESFTGLEGGKEGVKLEEQVLITETGCALLSTYPFEDDLLGREI